MTVQEHAVASATPSIKHAEIYDFGRPTTLAREHARVLELAFDTFARQWGTQLTSKVRVRSHVSCENVHMVTYDEYAASLPPTTAMVLCALEPYEQRMVIQFPASAGLTWVSSMVGGEPSSGHPERKFTQIEQGLVRRVIDDALEDLRYSFGSLLTDAVAVDTIHYNSQFAQAAATSDLVIVATFIIKVSEASSVATVAIPSDWVLPQLGETNPTETSSDAAELLEAQVQSTPVEVSLRLAPSTVVPHKILDLAVGDVVPLNHPQNRPLSLTVDGHPLARAAVGSNGTRLACVVIS